MHSKLRLFVLLGLAALALVGCHRRARTQGTVVATAGGQQQVVTVSHRHYRNLVRIAARDMSCRNDQVAPTEVSPGIFSVQGCGQMRDYVMVCRGRRHCRWVGVQPVEQVAIQETQCATGQIQLAVTGPLTRQVIACGQQLDYALACHAQGCMWARGAASQGMVMQSEPGTSVIIVAEDPGAAQVPEPPGAAADEVTQVGAAGTIQSLFATEIERVRQCTGGQPVTVRVYWDAAGTVGVALAGAGAGTAMEQCVQQAIGPVVLQGVGAAGEIQAQM